MCQLDNEDLICGTTKTIYICSVSTGKVIKRLELQPSMSKVISLKENQFAIASHIQPIRIFNVNSNTL